MDLRRAAAKVIMTLSLLAVTPLSLSLPPPTDAIGGFKTRCPAPALSLRGAPASVVGRRCGMTRHRASSGPAGCGGGGRGSGARSVPREQIRCMRTDVSRFARARARDVSPWCCRQCTLSWVHIPSNKTKQHKPMCIFFLQHVIPAASSALKMNWCTTDYSYTADDSFIQDYPYCKIHTSPRPR